LGRATEEGPDASHQTAGRIKDAVVEQQMLGEKFGLGHLVQELDGPVFDAGFDSGLEFSERPVNVNVVLGEFFHDELFNVENVPAT
jgi:hypothetical protein